MRKMGEAMKVEIITCDICGAKHERYTRNGIREYYLRLASFYPAGYAKDGKCIELDLCEKCATQVSAMVETLNDAFTQTLDDIKVVKR